MIYGEQQTECDLVMASSFLKNFQIEKLFGKLPVEWRTKCDVINQKNNWNEQMASFVTENSLIT